MSEVAKVAPTKSPFASKTLCVAVIAALAPLVGRFHAPFGEWLQSNGATVCELAALVFGGLRLVTSKPIAK